MIIFSNTWCIATTMSKSMATFTGSRADALRRTKGNGRARVSASNGCMSCIKDLDIMFFVGASLASLADFVVDSLALFQALGALGALKGLPSKHCVVEDGRHRDGWMKGTTGSKIPYSDNEPALLWYHTADRASSGYAPRNLSSMELSSSGWAGNASSVVSS